MKKKIITTLIVLSMGQAFAENTTTTATVTINSFCSISAQSIGFGVLSTPLSAQSASSSMSVLCSNKVPYTIDLIFGLTSNYWYITGGGGRWSDSDWSATASEVDGSGNVLRTVSFSYPNGTSAVAAMATRTGCQIMGDGRCYSTNSSSDYGILYGTAKRDTISYKILVPNDPSKIWAMGKNSYSSNGIGQEQNIPIQAQIVPQGTYYPASDIYNSTVSVTINY